MKKIILLLLPMTMCSAYMVRAQVPFSTIDSVSINNISATVLVHGDMFWNPAMEVAACEFPKGSGKSINFTSALWMSGYDGGNNLHVAAQTYRQDGNDYWPGPLDGSDTLTYATSHDWAKIWKVNRTDVQYFQAVTTHTTANTPPNILSWPGKGNIYAEGNGGAALTVTSDMAPFVDVNSNGIYEPLLGDYPDIKGDQALWWVFSDNGPVHTETKGKPLGVEIHAMAFAYNRGTLIDNVVYFDYTVTNKSVNNYSNFRLALFDDIDLGYYQDDFIGFDSTWRMGICYNGTDCDGCSAGGPANSYGTHPPIVGISMVVLPGDAGTSYVPAGSFVYYNNDFSIIGNPMVDTEYNNYIRAKMRNGTHFTNTFSGPGNPCLSQGSGPNTNYVFTGDPSSSGQWSECNCEDNPGDRRFIISSNDFTLNSGSVQHIVMALVTTGLDTNNGCPGAGFDSIGIYADTAWHDYYNPLLPLPPSLIKNIAATNGVLIYPNPAHDKLFVENTGSYAGEETIILYNTLGQVVNTPFNKTGQKWEVDVSGLPEGLYYVIYRNGAVQTTAKFVKE